MSKTATTDMLAPRAVKGVGIFYGWWIVFACMIGLVVCYSTFVAYAFGLFIRPLNKEFGWTRTEITGAFALGNLLVIAAAPLAGIALDRFGARKTLLPSIVAFACVVGAMGLIFQSIVSFYVLFLILPFAAAGTLPATFTRFVVAWFDRRRGLALGIALAGVGIGGALLPPITQFIISEFGWRTAFFSIAGMAMLFVLPIAAFFLINEPNEIDEAPDGDRLNDAGTNQNVSGLTLFETFKTLSFWILATAFVLLGMFTMGMAVHLAPMLGDRGIDPGTAASALSLIGVFLIFGRVLAGYLLDRLPPALVAFGCLAISSLGVAAIAFGVTGPLLFIAIGLIGFGIGAEFDFMSYFISRYFGMLSYGRIYGFTYGAFQVGGSIGPIMMAAIYEQSGTYTTGLWVLFGAIFLSACLFPIMGPKPLEKMINAKPETI